MKGGLSVEAQKSGPIYYDQLRFEAGYRADLIVEKKVLLELKSIETLLPVHAKQVLTYIRLANLRVGSLNVSPNAVPLSVTSVTSVRCFPEQRVCRPEATVSPKRSSPG